MGDESNENPTVNSAPQGLKYSTGHNHDSNLGSVVLVSVAGILNASSLGQLSWSKVVLAMIYRPPGFPLCGPGGIMIKCGLAVGVVPKIVMHRSQDK